MSNGELQKLKEDIGSVFLIKDPHITKLLAAAVISQFVSSDPVWIVVVAPSGGAKCLGKGTLVLMYDGTIKPAERIVVGDLLMGDDSTPRKVLATNKGKEQLFKIQQNWRGKDSYVVNKSHILSLKQRTTRKEYKNFTKGDTFDMSLSDYLKKPKSFKNNFCGYKVGVSFPERPVKLDPYFLGVWLGDGRRNYASITNEDKEVIEFLYAFAEENNLKVSTKKYPEVNAQSYLIVNKKRSKMTPNPINETLKSYGLMPEKFIPYDYKVNSEKVRLQTLAGLLDTDGSLQEKRKFTFVSKDKQLSEDVVFISRSLGLTASLTKKIVKLPIKSKKDGIYWKVSIGGNIHIIPTRIKRKQAPRRTHIVDSLSTPFTVIPLEKGEYFGFTLDGNGRFLLGDFTVTHNSEFVNMVSLFKWTPPGEDQAEQKVWPVSTLTSRTFVSGFKGGGKDPSLLLQITNGILTFKDLTSLLSEHKDDRSVIMAQLREIYDGKYSKKFGTGEEVTWTGKLTIIAGATYAIHTLKASYTAMGERFVFYNLIQPDRESAAEKTMENQEEGKMMEHRQRLAEMFSDYVVNVLNANIEDLPKIDKKTRKDVIALAELSTRARSDVERNWRSPQQELTEVHPPEMPTRFAGQLQAMIQALKIVNHYETGEFKLLESDTELINKLALDSVTKMRRIIMQELSKYEVIETAGLATKLGLPTNSVRRYLEDLTALEIADREKGSGNKGDRWNIKPHYRELMTRFEGIVYEEGKDLTEDSVEPTEDQLLDEAEEALREEEARKKREEEISTGEFGF